MKEINNTLSFREKVLLVLMGLFAFSTFSSTVSSFLHFPLTLPEPFFIIFLILLRKRFLPISIDGGLFIILTIILVFSVLLSQIVGTYSLYAVLSSARGYLYLFLFYTVFKKNNKLTVDDLLYISFGTLIGWSVACIISFQNILSNPNDNFQTYGNMITVALFIIIAILKRQWKLFAVGMTLLLVISFMSGIRRVIAVILMAFVLSLLFQYLKRRKSLLRLFVTSLLIAIPFFYIVPAIGNYAEENAPALYFRLFTKSERFFSGESDTSDDYRKESFIQFQEDLGNYMLPRGMVSNQYLTDEGTGIYMDFPLLALSYIFSFPIAFLLVVFFMIKTFQCYMYYKFTTDMPAGVFTIAIMIMFFLLFVEGSFLVHPYITPFTGLCLGRVCYYSRKYKQLIISHKQNMKI